MEPLPPPDAELRIIIDKLAIFVARNGPEFEEMTKSKQKNNPKFGFLFGGDFYDYYAWKVMNQQKALGHHEPEWPPQASSGRSEFRERIQALENQQKTLRDQIRESESNLLAQEEVMEQQTLSVSTEAISSAKFERLELLGADTGLSLEEMSHVFQPIIDSCTKDSISSGKSWIFANATSHDKNQLIAHYLSYRVTQEDVSFLTRLHLIYLMNDVLHHCVRKNADELKHSLESVAVEMFCAAALHANDDQQLKLNKLINLWESKSIFSMSTLSKMRQPEESWQSYKQEISEDYRNEVRNVTESFKSTLENYKAQHHNFVAHANANIQSLSLQIDSIHEQMSVEENVTGRSHEFVAPPPQDTSSSSSSLYTNPKEFSSSHEYPIPPTHDYPPPQAPWSATPPGSEDQSQRPSRWDESSQWQQQQHQQKQPPTHNQPPYGPPPQIPVLPDLSRPPPGFNPSLPPPGIPPHHMPPLTPQQQQPSQQQQPQPHPPSLMSITPMIDDKALQPTLPYYDLPAGLMVPLVRLEDQDYKRPIDPSKIRLPPPAPPTDRLLASLEAFYSQPSHESPRDLDGFEILGLFEYSKEKNSATEKKKNDILCGRREESPAISPERWSMSSTPEPRASPIPQHNRHRRESNEGNRKSKRRSYRSRTRSRSGSRESTPDRRRSGMRRSPSPSSYSMPSYLTKRSPSPQQRRSRRRSGSPDNDSYHGGSRNSSPAVIDSSNKGHQMMQRMGWKSGTGLGSSESGIVEPISGGEVRDRKDLYKGVGISNSDPFEAFRKNKAGSYYTRMKERSDSRK
uniref:Calcium homeostasis endoplasmic reticulum proteinlike [Bombyx mori] n=1 Tax=Lepeophtheirus salmonis TaxID=72036 RepID=A0A0K2TGR8_LEPSM